MKINAILVIFCAQNKIATENVRTVIALVNTCLTFLIRTTCVVNDIHCIRDAKVRNFYVYKFMNNRRYHWQNILNLLLFCFLLFFVYVYLLLLWGVQTMSNTGKVKNMQVWVTNTVTISLMNAVYVAEINQYG